MNGSIENIQILIDDLTEENEKLKKYIAELENKLLIEVSKNEGSIKKAKDLIAQCELSKKAYEEATTEAKAIKIKCEEELLNFYKLKQEYKQKAEKAVEEILK